MEQGQKFSVSHLDNSQFSIDGLRPFFEYRDLGIKDATNGRPLRSAVREGAVPREGTTSHSAALSAYT